MTRWLIEKSGTGIEKSGTGLRRAFLSCALTAITFSASANPTDVAPEGLLQIAANGDSLKVSWIFDNSVFSGVAELNGSFASVVLTEISLARNTISSQETVGSGTGKETVGSGTGKETVGNGTGIETVGSGTGVDTVGSGTGSDTVGSGTGSDAFSGGETLVLTVGSGVSFPTRVTVLN